MRQHLCCSSYLYAVRIFAGIISLHVPPRGMLVLFHAGIAWRLALCAIKRENPSPEVTRDGTFTLDDRALQRDEGDTLTVCGKSPQRCHSERSEESLFDLNPGKERFLGKEHASE
jgi:hypothetical protein